MPAFTLAAVGVLLTAWAPVAGHEASREDQQNDAGHCSTSDRADPEDQQQQIVASAAVMQHVDAEQLAKPVLRDEDAGCAEWAASGECTKNPSYMQSNCALSCVDATGHRKPMRLLVIRTNRCASTAFGGWLLRAVRVGQGRLEVYRADDGEVAQAGITKWAARVNAVLNHRTIGPFPAWDWVDSLGRDSSEDDVDEVSRDAQKASAGGRSTLIVTFIRSPMTQLPSAFGSFKSSGMGYYGESVSDTLSRPPQPENWRLDNMNARSLGWGPLVSGAWDKKLNSSQERHDTGMPPQKFVALVEREVDLVLIADYMVESLVLLRRVLGFSATVLRSDLALLKGINAHDSKVSGLNTSLGPGDRARICSDTWSAVDCALFEHFNASLWEKVEAGGEAFAAEVRDVRRHWSTLNTCCEMNSCALTEQIETCDRIRDSANTAATSPVIVQF